MFSCSLRNGLLAVLVALLSGLTFARELRWTHFGLRPLAMGNAFVAVADDFNAIFYNPAGLARLKDWHEEVLNPTLAIAQNTRNTVSILLNLAGGSSGQLTNVLDIFQKEAGLHHYFAFQQTPYFVMKNFGFGLGLDLSASMVIHGDIDVEFQAGPTIIAPISVAFSFLEDKLSLGASLKALMTGGVDRTFDIDTIEAFASGASSGGKKIKDFVEGGVGYGADIGFLFTPFEVMAPTFGLSVTDLGGSAYTKANVGGAALGSPPSRLPSVNAGVSIKPWNSAPSYVLLAADGDMLNQAVHFSHKFNVGAEWGYSEIIKVQAGLKDGYLTSGLQFDVGTLKLRILTYVVDHGPVVALHQKLLERRYAMQLKLII